MKCSQCGKEFTDAEWEKNKGLCPECGGKPQGAESEAIVKTTEEAENKKTSSVKKIIAAVAVVAAAAIAAMALIKPSDDTVEHINPTAIAYVTKDTVGLAKDGRTLDLYINNVMDLNGHQQVQQMFSASVPYIGKKNYVELASGETVYIPLSVNSVEKMDGKLCSLNAKGEETVLDEEAGMIYCHSDNSIYYNKVTDGKLHQLRYSDGKTMEMSELFGEENILAVSVSNDDSLMQVVRLDDNQQTVAGGYFYNGRLHMLDTKYIIFNIAKNGKEVFVMEMEDEYGLATLYRVKDLESEELEFLGKGISEAVVYDDGSAAMLTDVDLNSNQYNPTGTILMYDAQKGTVQKAAEDAVALVESSIRSSGWMNENGRDITTTEISRRVENDAPLYSGQVHYIDAQGNLCAASAQEETPGQNFVISEGFYDIENYSFNEEVAFATSAQGYIYWSRGTDLFRYKLGSMEKPQAIPLNESIGDKVNISSAQVGYLTCGSGDIVEESQDKLILKNFEDENSVTILENVGKLHIIGLDNAGKNIYFLSEDNSLYSKSVETKSNPKHIASNVVQAQATSDGLYYMTANQDKEKLTVGASAEDGGQNASYDLMFVEHGGKRAKTVKEDVQTISALYVEP